MIEMQPVHKLYKIIVCKLKWIFKSSHDSDVLFNSTVNV